MMEHHEIYWHRGKVGHDNLRFLPGNDDLGLGY